MASQRGQLKSKLESIAGEEWNDLVAHYVTYSHVEFSEINLLGIVLRIIGVVSEVEGEEAESGEAKKDERFWTSILMTFQQIENSTGNREAKLQALLEVYQENKATYLNENAGKKKRKTN